MKSFIKILLPSAFSLLPSFLFAQLLDSAQFNAAKIYTHLNEALENPDKVYRLDLSKKKLKVFPMEILKCKNLQELNLSKNKLDSLPEEIGLLTNLQVLNVSGNKLQYLPDSIGELKNLKKLVGSRNSLIALPKRIGDLESIEILDLWENDLSVFPEELSKLKKLRWMDLRVIMIDDNQEERIRQLLPKAKIFFSPNCHCVTG
ncbi:MAG: leucine-rich repeat domain-containing protein [Bacteroidetes bacterium]|nr:leucine-rich repeat domain-containing protein [Bacteroidota bacterium]